MLIVINDKVQSDPLDRVLHVVDLHGTGQIASRSSSGAGQAALADDRIFRAVRKCSRTAQLLFADLLNLVLTGDQDPVIAPAVMPGKRLLEPERGKFFLQFCGNLSGAVIPEQPTS